MIEAHIQYNGGWKTYLTYNPNLRCEFDDHRTCLEASKKLQDNADAVVQAAIAEQQRVNQEAVDKAAKEAETNAAQAEIDKAGQAKHEATRIVNKDAALSLQAIDEASAKETGETRAKAEAACQEIEKARLVQIADVQEKRRKALEAINAKDWLSHLRATPPSEPPAPDLDKA